VKRRSVAGPLAKSIVFMVVTTLATLLLAISIANTGVRDTNDYYAKFTDVTALNVGDSVRIAGVRVGQVQSIGVTDRKYAQVKFSVERGRQLPASATASIRYLNLVGQRYIELGQGAGAVGTLNPGGMIPLERTSAALNLTELFSGFRPLFEALSPKDVNQLSYEIVQVLQGESGTVDSLIATVGQLTTTLADKDVVIGSVIDNLTAVVETVNARQDRFEDLITTLRQLVSGFAADRQAIGDSLGALGDLATSTGDLLRDSRAPLREDIHELGRTADLLNRNEPVVEEWLQELPGKMTTLGRLASYGSWLNFYMCQATVGGVQWERFPDEPYAPTPTGPPPTGIPVTESRCKA
jgi:phospholipid/cholesterol/gamma-HCH transport system substrate-binding protein